MLSRDIIRELECVIEKNKGQIVGFGETKIEYMARDCLETIRTLQAEIDRLKGIISALEAVNDELREIVKGGAK